MANRVPLPRAGHSVWQLAWPSVLANALYSFVGLATVKVAGNMGAEAIAAVNNGGRLFFIFQALLFGLMGGTSALVAQAIGANRREEAASVTMLSICIGGLIGIATTLVFALVPEWLAGLFLLDDATTRLTAQYLFWCAPFAVAHVLLLVLSSAVRAAGDVRNPLWLGAMSSAISILLLFVLVPGVGPIPPLGVAGAAIAQGLGFALGGVLFFSIWRRNRLVVPWILHHWYQRERMRSLLRIASPAMLEQVVFNLGLIFYVWLIAQYGTKSLAAYGIGVQVLLLTILIGVGFQIANATLVGQAIGARQPLTAYRVGLRGMWMAVAVMSVVAFGLMLVAEPVSRFLIDDDEVVELAVVIIWTLGVMQPLMAIEFSLSGALRAAGDTRYPFLFTICGLFGRVLLALMVIWLQWSVEWVFVALVIDYIIKAVLYIMRYRARRWTRVARKYNRTIFPEGLS